MSENLAYEVNMNIINKKMANPLASYTQSNCQVSLTDDGYHIYRPPNVNVEDNGNTMWGGFVMRFYQPPFIKGHRYIINLEVKGKTSNSPTISETYWTNNCGWGGGGLEPQPSDVVKKGLDAGFNSNEWVTVSYAWTINDDIYKTCTTSYSSFVQGTVYPSYRDFKFGFGYVYKSSGGTGSLGTDLYIKNVRMYDLTTASQIDIKKTGVVEAGSFWETLSKQEAAFHHDGEITSNCFYEI